MEAVIANIVPIVVNHTWNTPTLKDLELIRVWDSALLIDTYINPNMYDDPEVVMDCDASVTFVYGDRFWWIPK